MKTIWLLRHPETEFNIAGKIQGHCESPITALGHRQTQALERYFQTVPIELVFSSDLERAASTAARLARICGKEVQSLALLRERSFGVHEQTFFHDYLALVGDKHSDIHFRPERGESVYELFLRASKALELLQGTTAKNILIVSHGGFNRCLLSAALRLEPSRQQDFTQANCCINKLVENKDGSFEAKMLNFTEHLSGCA